MDCALVGYVEYMEDMDADILLQAEPRPSKRRSFSRLSDKQWLQVQDALDRGHQWQDIFEALPTGAYKSRKAFQNAYYLRKRKPLPALGHVHVNGRVAKPRVDER